MSLTRRELLHKAGAGAVAGAVPGLARPIDQPRALPYFGLHSFIEANPKAVFIRRTHVPHKMDEAAKRREGVELAREIFVPLDRPGIPVTHQVAIKPNATFVRTPDRPDVDLWGTSTDAQFYEGMVMGLKELGVRKLHFIEANHYQRWNLHGYVDINQRHGVEMNEPERHERNFRDGHEMTWTKVPGGVVYTRIPYYAPVNEPDTFLLNIAKWKAHYMGMTQTVKNLQGTVVIPYVKFCCLWATYEDGRVDTRVPEFMKQDIHPQAEARVKRYHANHLKLGYARWDTEAPGPLKMEIWSQKSCDNLSVLNTGLSMIEGIYGRDGDGFRLGEDHLTNLVFFGKDRFRLDLIGLWLAGHEPGNVGLYRIAKERGLSDTFNPWEVPVYEWIDGKAVPRKLTDFPRTPLKTRYLRKPGEPEYHLLNEPFDYGRVKV